MRLPTTAPLVLLLLAGTAGCANDSSSTSVADSQAATPGAPIGSRDQICEAVYQREGVASPHMKEPVVLDYYHLLGDPDDFSATQRVAIRRAYFTLQETAYRSLAATATDTRVSTALRAFADGWAELAQGTSAALSTSVHGPPSEPDRAALDEQCPRHVNGVVVTPAAG